MQRVFCGIKSVSAALSECAAKQIFIVRDRAFDQFSIASEISALPFPHVVFDNFTPNPVYEDVVSGVRLFNNSGCDCILAIGGGSTIDMAKCIKLYCRMDHDRSYLSQEYVENNFPILAIPTTAGTGSESTRIAVIYSQGEKQSISHDAILPAHVVFDPSVLNTLPLYQRKCTMLDALCQAIESWWSIASTEESKALSKLAIEIIIRNMRGYLSHDPHGNCQMMRAANLSGRAIDIAHTTAAHAMSYKLTTLYGIAHGHAVALCLPAIWRYMAAHIDQCTDSRGAAYVRGMFDEIAAALGQADTNDAITWFEALLAGMRIVRPDHMRELDIPSLAIAVNPARLRNNPVAMDHDVAAELYRVILATNT